MPARRDADTCTRISGINVEVGQWPHAVVFPNRARFVTHSLAGLLLRFRFRCAVAHVSSSDSCADSFCLKARLSQVEKTIAGLEIVNTRHEFQSVFSSMFVPLDR